MTYVHAVKGMQKNDVGLASIINDDLVQVPSSHIATDDECVRVGHAAKVDISCIKGQQHVRPLHLNDGSYDYHMINPSVVIPFCYFVLKIGARPSGDHVNHSLKGGSTKSSCFGCGGRCLFGCCGHGGGSTNIS